MLNQNLKKLINLAKRTNSPLIITDPDGSEPVVLMSVEQYEDLTVEFDPDEYDFCDEEDWHEDYAEPPLHSEEVEPLIEEFEAPAPEDEIFEGEISSESEFEAEKSDDLGTEEQFYLEPIE